MSELIPPYIDKEISWLAFNERVLQEAADKTVPIVERVRFLGIFSNNMDEFFRVRVADIKRRLLICQENNHPDEIPTRNLLNDIQSKVLDLQEEFDEIYSVVLQGLEKHNIHIINEDQIPSNLAKWVHTYFIDKLQRFITPIILDENTKMAHALKDDLTYLITALESKNHVSYAAIEVPTRDAPRFVELPKIKGSRKKNIMLLDNIIRFCADDIFKPFFKYDRCRMFSFKMTRDAEYGLADDIDQSLVEQMSEGLKQRLTAAPVRFVYDKKMPDHMVDMIKGKLGISSLDATVPGGRYHNFRDFIKFPNVGRSYLESDKLPALNCKKFDRHTNVFEAISKQDILLYYPYHKFRYTTEFLRQAAYDPDVREIKICVYRLAKESRIVKSLIDAVENGKQVTVFIELAARFDEEANIEWAKELKDSNVKVEFGIPSLKCHAKIILITRKQKDKLVRYAHIGTGNFHEGNAKVYTDLSLFTANQEIAEEVFNVFDFLSHSYRQYDFEHLIVSPNSTRNKLNELIDNEIDQAKKGRKAEIKIKINNIDDRRIINKLYQASNAGVKVLMIVRGMCSLVPGVKGYSENIEVISIVDRFLEHPRFVIFHNAGKSRVYIMSFDLMERNLDRRVEVGSPVYDKKLKKHISEIFDCQWSDTMKARVIDQKQTNKYKPRGNKRKIRSQTELYDYFKEIETPSL